MQAQINEDKQRAQREIRKEVYIRYQRAATAYADRPEFRRCADVSPERLAELPECRAMAGSGDEKYLALISAQDQVFTHGSQEALDVALKFDQLVVPMRRYLELEVLAYAECSGATGKGLTGVPGMGPECAMLRRQADEARLKATLVNAETVAKESLGEFRMVMCRELNSIPRESCKR
ncbi:hypothetical protein GCM10017774_13900 [Lentzea cavernae]|uniref:Uncharacterized protein n=1 Tax=Lentzea cavernae TaxID=2020703 RepID=A0ABQ3M3I3_9PSEU|nr:hypothetical protein GCM10017774_13900 [Lentzea cavernae]